MNYFVSLKCLRKCSTRLSVNRTTRPLVHPRSAMSCAGLVRATDTCVRYMGHVYRKERLRGPCAWLCILEGTRAPRREARMKIGGLIQPKRMHTPRILHRAIPRRANVPHDDSFFLCLCANLLNGLWSGCLASRNPPAAHWRKKKVVVHMSSLVTRCHTIYERCGRERRARERDAKDRRGISALEDTGPCGGQW